MYHPTLQDSKDSSVSQFYRNIPDEDVVDVKRQYKKQFYLSLMVISYAVTWSVDVNFVIPLTTPV